MSAWCIFTFIVHLVMDLWYTCDALVDFDGLVMDLWIYLDGLKHLLLYMWYILWWMCGWMRYICDGRDIYVIYVCMNLFVMMECKKNQKLPFWVTLTSAALGKGPCCRVPWSQHSAKLEKWALEKPFFQLCRVPWPWYSAKNFFLKKSNFAERRPGGTRQRIFRKKN